MRSRWWNIIVLNVREGSEEISCDAKESFMRNKKNVFDYVPKYHTKILLGDFNEKLG